MGETKNNIIGSTINPYNRNLSAGGASGGISMNSQFQYIISPTYMSVGEGVPLALKGSSLGWGSDIGKRQNFSVA